MLLGNYCGKNLVGDSSTFEPAVMFSIVMVLRSVKVTVDLTIPLLSQRRSTY